MATGVGDVASLGATPHARRYARWQDLVEHRVGGDQSELLVGDGAATLVGSFLAVAIGVRNT
jgi:hypothetical protein